ncbi:hypothetical protein [Roseivivax isoporae]|uniref:Flagellar motor switch protein n=1 Tax=Roseivivax isoporae LMG 25204 TaxID=1449351 RepID=X7F7Y1_9RHOB|nr:hypothetical protein [Roseivivax isoporae]ETX28910.1 hypothetical protein RISW2_04145 [Roseivivax isoporae LMG 25204]
MTGLFIDMMIMALLLGAIGFGLVLERRVRRLMQVLQELQPAVDQFAQAVDRTEETVVALRGRTSGREAPAPQPETAATRLSPLPTMRNLRNQAARAMQAGTGVAAVEGKADMVRSFFETAQRRQS